MSKYLVFFQGGAGVEDHDTDAPIVASLKSKLGPSYLVHYPLLPEETAPDFGRRKQIDYEISAREGELILVGHSLGASMLLTYLSENRIEKQLQEFFLSRHLFGAATKNGFKPSSSRLILPKSWIEKYLCFFITVRMTKLYRLII